MDKLFRPYNFQSINHKYFLEGMIHKSFQSSYSENFRDNWCIFHQLKWENHLGNFHKIYSLNYNTFHHGRFHITKFFHSNIRVNYIQRTQHCYCVASQLGMNILQLFGCRQLLRSHNFISKHMFQCDDHREYHWHIKHRGYCKSHSIDYQGI